MRTVDAAFNLIQKTAATAHETGVSEERCVRANMDIVAERFGHHNAQFALAAWLHQKQAVAK